MRIGSGTKTRRVSNRRRKGPKSKSLAAAVDAQVHDRIATELPDNAHVKVIEIDDPYSELGKQERINAVQSLKNDPLAWMRAHNRIDEACYLAGREWQKIYAKANIGAIASLDPTKEAVSGGRFNDGITDTHLGAFSQLREAEIVLHTEENKHLIFDLLVREVFPQQIAAEHGDYTDWRIRKWAKKLYHALNILAIHFNYALPDSKPFKRPIQQ